MSRSSIAILLLALAVGVALRWPAGSERPMHNDEAVNGIKFGQLWDHGTYKYDPNEHHGPSLYYFAAAVGRLTGAPGISAYTDSRLRWVTVLFGAGLLLLLPLLADGLGKNGTTWAALFTAVSPALVFYSAYFIHEMLLVFFTLLALGAGWRYWRTRRIGWALFAGAGVGLMSATKETFPLTVAAAGLALGLNQLWNRLLDASGAPVRAPRLNPWHIVAGLLVSFGFAATLFTSFFTNWSGLLDSIRTYLPWLNRAGGDSPHIHSWTFYLQRLLWFHTDHGPVWSEGMIGLLAVVGGAAGFLRRNLGRTNASFTRFLAIYTFLITGFYTFIAYKTPWCLLNFLLPMVLLAGIGAAVMVRSVRRRTARVTITALLLAGAAYLAWLAYESMKGYAADRRNPYVYAQTSKDALNLVREVSLLSDASPQGPDMVIKVVAAEGDYWPLPWYLRRFRNVGWWEQVPPDPYAPVMIVSAKLHAALDEKKSHVMVRYFELRPQVFHELYVDVDLWKRYLQKHPPRTE